MAHAQHVADFVESHRVDDIRGEGSPTPRVGCKGNRTTNKPPTLVPNYVCLAAAAHGKCANPLDLDFGGYRVSDEDKVHWDRTDPFPSVEGVSD